MNDNEFTSFDRYICGQRRALADRMAPVKRVYLDTNYWLFLRDVRDGRPRSSTHRLLYEKLATLVASGRVVCPASDTVIYEVFRQSDPNTRLATATIIDELSGGIALQGTFQRARTEILHFLRSQRESQHSLYPLSDWVWTHPCWILGEIYPVPENRPIDLQNSLQIGFYAYLAKLGIVDLVNRLGEAPGIEMGTFFDQLAERLTAGKLYHSGEIRSRKQMFLTEIAGALDAHREDIAGALAHVRDVGAVSADDVNAEIRLIVEMFRTDRIGPALPFFNIQAGLHAVFRWNRDQKFKPNDWNDHLHAAAALPYCDLLLTERTLARTIASPALRYDALYNTRVCSDPKEALQSLDQF